MRWSRQTLDTLAAPPTAGDALPLALPAAVVRTFDTPGFAGMTFYEVQAKSIINRVPGSRFGFSWTINPYRGCSHACTYCMAGDTPILMADGRTRPLAELAAGDRIYGTVRSGDHRRYAATEVLAHWSTVKPAYRITLADGTQLVASGDHRFLTNRGWKHVTGQRAYLTTGNTLIGTGGFAAPPKPTEDYRRGYLCGLIRGGALDRSRRYLAEAGIPADEAPLQQLGAWPEFATGAWSKGFLAGIFDAVGSNDGGPLRIPHTDPEIIAQVAIALGRLGFEYAVESRGRANRMRSIRLVGGLSERLRFFHTVDPAIIRKRTIDGIAIKSTTRLDVTSIEPLGLELPLYDITTGTGDFIANGVVSHNCFARNSHTYLDLDAGEDFDRRVVVKVNAGEQLRRELTRPGWRGELIAMGTNVDCYQRAEGKYQLMREILTALRDFANPFSILTKGTLILRDLDLLRQAAAVTEVGLAVSVGSIDQSLWRTVEPGTPSPRRRLDVVRRLTDAGFQVGVLMAPILPGLTDDDASIEATAAAIAGAGAASLTPIVLHLRPGSREWYGRWLAREHPRLVPRYRELYARGAYAPKDYQETVTARARLAARRHGLGGGTGGGPRQVPAAPTPEQPTLW